MSYGIDATNDQALAGIGQTKNPYLEDIIFFTDCTQAQGTTPLWLDGGIYYTNAANGGAVGNNTVLMLNAFGYTACSGVISLQTGTTNNATGYAYSSTAQAIADTYGNILYIQFASDPPPLPTTITDFLVEKQEYETAIRTSTAIHSNTVRGAFRLGFQNWSGSAPSNTAPTIGKYFEFLCDGTVTDTNWILVVSGGPSSTLRFDTGVAVSTNTTYRMYLSTEFRSAYDPNILDWVYYYIVNYKIKNMTTGTVTEGTVPSPLDGIDSGNDQSYFYDTNLGSVTMNTKAVTATTTSITLFVDYICTRNRRPVSREILIAP